MKTSACCTWFCIFFPRKKARNKSLEELHSQPAFEKSQAPPEDLIRGMLEQAEHRKSMGQHRCIADRNALVHFTAANTVPIGAREIKRQPPSPPRSASFKHLDR
ncbi:unnamed protein product [Amoebophrya sp. A120]|nr:unnamed protein product [Amoebophrya sp. A120]|eukprot:GSA120T00001346001.1